MVRHFHELRSAYGTSLFEILVKVCKFSITSNLLEPSSRICSSWGRPCTSETTCTRKVKGMNQRQVGRSIGDDILSSADSYHYFIILKENETKMELLKVEPRPKSEPEKPSPSDEYTDLCIAWESSRVSCWLERY